MPLTKSGKEVMASMKKEYGDKKAEEVFYASINKGKAGSSKWHAPKGRGIEGGGGHSPVKIMRREGTA